MSAATMNEMERLRRERDEAFAKGKQAFEELRRVEAERDELTSKLEQVRDGVMNAPVASGICCCGESMDGHSEPMMCGHSPVDEWDHYKDGLFGEEPSASLARLKAGLMEYLADEVRSMHEKASRDGIAAHLEYIANELRRQAEEGE